MVLEYSYLTSCRPFKLMGRPGNDRMVVGFTTTYILVAMESVPITTNIVSSNPAHGEMYLIQHYVIKLVSDLWQVGDFLRILRFSPPIKPTATIQLNYC